MAWHRASPKVSSLLKSHDPESRLYVSAPRSRLTASYLSHSPPCLPPVAATQQSPARQIQPKNQTTRINPLRVCRMRSAALTPHAAVMVSNCYPSMRNFSLIKTFSTDTDNCLDELARVICAEDNEHIHPKGGDVDSLGSEETCKCDEGRLWEIVLARYPALTRTYSFCSS